MKMYKKYPLGITVINILGIIYFIFAVSYAFQFIIYAAGNMSYAVRAQFLSLGWNLILSIALPVGCLGVLYLRKWSRFVLIFWAITIFLTKIN